MTSMINAGSRLNDEEKHTLCRLYEQSAALTQLGAYVGQTLERFMGAQAAMNAADVNDGEQKIRFEKRKHEYLRFGRK
ncbi:(pine wood nematode) hypothetical protein [Aphelenchoides fujianensis]|nr:(pine wood nematode) hypothetical protein [Aphelenchoides fujianensis]